MRKNSAPKRNILPDPVYNSRLVTKAINTIMLDGKKGLAQNILYSSFDLIEKKTGEKGIDVFKKALENIIPSIELRVRRIAGSNYQVPTPVSKERRITLALRWLILYSRNRNEKTMVERLAGEIIDASKLTGSSVKKKEDTHKMAEANKAFAHLRF
ncbi:MAG: 30S ribosomal protein S7 [Mycoplasmoidaceae bacterium]